MNGLKKRTIWELVLQIIWGCKMNKEKEKEYKELFKIANNSRQFEIKLFWERAKFFMIIIGALFTAYCTVVLKENIESLVKISIILLGYVSSFFWFLCNLGSKFWQENWEAYMKKNSKISKECEIFQKTYCLKNSILAQRFSVSKLVIVFSALVSFIWFVLIIDYLKEYDSLVAMVWLLSLILVSIISIVVTFTCKEKSVVVR